MESIMIHYGCGEPVESLVLEGENLVGPGIEPGTSPAHEERSTTELPSRFWAWIAYSNTLSTSTLDLPRWRGFVPYSLAAGVQVSGARRCRG
jgi:hypothetical protein